MQHKRAYLKEIFDKVEIIDDWIEPKPQSKSDLDFFDFGNNQVLNDTKEKKKNKKTFKNENHRILMFCSCGHKKEYDGLPYSFNYKVFIEKVLPKIEIIDSDLSGKNKDIWDISLKQEYTPNIRKDKIYGEQFLHKFYCEKCKKKYENTNEFFIIGSYKKRGGNYVRTIFKTLENEKSITLYNISTHVLVSLKSRNIIYKETKSHLTFNKKEKCFYMTGKPIMRLPVKNFHSYIFQFFNNHVDILKNEKLMSVDELNKFVDNPVKEFISKLSNHLNLKDFKRIENIIDFEKNNMFLDKILHSIQMSYQNTSFDDYSKRLILTKDLEKEDASFFLREHISNIKKICSLGPIIMYPPFATLFFEKGSDFFLNFSSAWPMPKLTNLKKINPSSPMEILSECIKIKIEQDNKIKKARQKFVDKYQSNPNAKNIKEINYKHIFDFKIPDIKKGEKLKNIKITKKLFNNLNSKNIYDFSDSIFGLIKQENTRKNFYWYFDKYDFKTVTFFFEELFNISDFEPNDKHIEFLLNTIQKEGYVDNAIQTKYIRRGILTYYRDTLSLLRDLERNEKEIFKYNTVEKIENFHDELSKVLQTKRDEKLNLNIITHCKKFKDLECEIGDIKFELLDDIEKLIQESSEMNHCVKTYATRVGEEKFIIFKVKNLKTEDRATLSFYRDLNKSPYWNFEQLKSKFNKPATIEIKKASSTFIKKIGAQILYSSNDLKIIEEENINNVTFQ